MRDTRNVVLLVISITANTTAVARQNGISRHTIDFLMVIGVIMAIMPRIRQIFAMLLPRTLPNAMPLLPFIAEIILTAISGADVPNATRVIPTMKSEMLYLFAIAQEPSIKMSEPFMRRANPSSMKISCSIICVMSY